MKVFKTIDFFIQAVLLLLITIALIIQDEETLNPGMFIILLGVWQIISILANLALGLQPWKKKAWRKYHLIGTALVLLLLLISLMQDSAARTGDKDDKYSMAGLGTILIAMIPAALMGLFYVCITFAEWRKIKQLT